jgi:hypothetical protein
LWTDAAYTAVAVIVAGILLGDYVGMAVGLCTVAFVIWLVLCWRR